MSENGHTNGHKPPLVPGKTNITPLIKPEQIVGKNKIRDAQICLLFLYENMNQQEIAEKMGITRTRVGQVLYANRALLISETLDADYERLQRIQYYKRKAETADETKHDKEYWIDKIKEEVDRDGRLAEGSQPAVLNRLLSMN